MLYTVYKVGIVKEVPKYKGRKVKNKDVQVRNKGGKVKNKGGNVFDREEPPWVIKYSTYVGGNRAEY